MLSRKLIEYIDESEDLLSLSAAKKAGNIVRTDQDDLITAMIDEAVDWCSQQVGYSVRRAYCDYYFGMDNLDSMGQYQGQHLVIPSNVLSVEAVYYRDDNDTEQTLSSTDWEFVNIGSERPYVRIINEPDLSSYAYAYRVRIVEGFYTYESGSTGNANNVLPYSVLTAMKMQFVAIYQNRTDINVVQTFGLHEGAKARLMPFSKLIVV